jgi:N-acetylmuramoyl-L-alanine amidase
MIVVLDPGHGGRDPGATSPVDPKRQDMLCTEEDDLAYDIAQKAQRCLLAQRKHTAYLTRQANQFISLEGRADLANKLNADAFVSIHINAGQPAAEGIETFSYPGAKGGGRLRDCVHAEVAKSFPDWPNRGAKEANHYVTHHTSMPACLVECGFITNVMEEKALYDPDVRQRFAEAIARGVTRFLEEVTR